MDLKSLENKAKEMITLYKENIHFIKYRIRVQKQSDYTPVQTYTQHRERQYYSLDIFTEMRKILAIKRNFFNLTGYKLEY